jgi:anti-sigma factor RsiW
MTECREVRRVLGSFIDLALDPQKEADVRRHLEGCEACSLALAEAEPPSALAIRLAAIDVPADASFVGDVMAGVHQRRVERRLAHHRRRWLAAAAGLLIAVFGGWAVMHEAGRTQQTAEAPRPLAAPKAAPSAKIEPAFVEVEGDGVRLYQLDSPAQGAVKVAFVVDPHLEL